MSKTKIGRKRIWVCKKTNALIKFRKKLDFPVKNLKKPGSGLPLVDFLVEI
ncbi:MAG: hypothetical protein Ta2B_07330 [Termitinemataceae bacterium]|nr:MAG: hypothetical protein Ta2B_07330 [Termitinemataceae bacterium]